MKNALVLSQSKLLNYYQVCYCSRYLVHFGINTHFINPFIEGFSAYLLFKGWNWAFIFIVVLLGGIFILLWCLFFICHMIIILDTVCFLLAFVLCSSQCSCSFLSWHCFMKQIFGVNTDSIFSNVKKTLTLISRCMHLKKWLISNKEEN